MGQSWSQYEDVYLMNLMGSDGNYIPIGPGADPSFPDWPTIADALAAAFPNPIPGTSTSRTYTVDSVSHHWYYELKPILIREWAAQHPDMLYEDMDEKDGSGEAARSEDGASVSSGGVSELSGRSDCTVWPANYRRDLDMSLTPRGSLVRGTASRGEAWIGRGGLKRVPVVGAEARPQKKTVNWEDAAQKLEGDYAIAYQAVQQMKLRRGGDGEWESVYGG